MPPPCLHARGRVALYMTLIAGVLYGLHHAAPRGRIPAGRTYAGLNHAGLLAWPPQTSSPQSFPYDCSRPANVTAALLAPLVSPSPPPAFPAWITALCPEVVAHFAAFPYFSNPHPAIPVMTTVQAAHQVCTLKIVADIGGRVGADLLLVDGSFIGALRHGGPVPWDDDADLALPFWAGVAFLERCAGLAHAFHPDITVRCQRHSVFIKVYVEDACADNDGSPCPEGPVSQPTPKPWRWPYADIFLYRTTSMHWQESTLSGAASPRNHSFPLESVFPSRPYYFGGLTLRGPRADHADAAHPSWTACRTSQFDHRREAWVSGEVADTRLNCCEAARFVPFVVGGNGTRLVGRDGRQVVIGIRPGLERQEALGTNRHALQA